MPGLDRVRHGWVVAGLVGIAMIHHAMHWGWYIEDAAISFAYADHLAMGEGLVPFEGGERVEGYSNPAWVFLLAVIAATGLDLFEAVRWLQPVLCAGVIVAGYLAAREALRGSGSPHLALIAPTFLAISAQLALWGGAGLEMSLMSLLIALALWRSLVEVRIGGWPWSALLWVGVSLCRPEAILYAAVAGLCAMVAQLRTQRSLWPTLRWLLTFFLPFGLYQAWRYGYFAWELPNTYYAKLERRPPLQLLDWDSRSWRYTRGFFYELGWGWLAPIWLLGVMGPSRWRAALGGSLVLGVAVGLAGLGLSWAIAVPPLGVAVLAVGAPLVGLGSRAWQARSLTWLLCVVALVFALIAQWDWMRGYRWYAPAVVPASVLLPLGIASLGSIPGIEGTRRRAVELVASVGSLGLLAWLSAAQTRALVDEPQVGPRSIQARARHVGRIQDRLAFEERFVVLDIDQGGYLFWSDFEMIDIIGLIDVPFGRHKYHRGFVHEYLFEEVRPHVVHLPEQLARKSRIPKDPQWSADYVRLDDRLFGTRPFFGLYLRRDLLVAESWERGGPGASFAGGVTLHGLDVPSEPAVTRRVSLELGLSTTGAAGFRVIVFVSDAEGALHSWELPPGHDWLTPDAWRPGEIITDRFELQLPDALTPGTYDLGVVLLGDDGTVLAASEPSPEPRLAVGEIRFEGALVVMSLEERAAAAVADREAAVAAAADGRCAEAEALWTLSRRHRPGDPSWLSIHQPPVHRALAECYARASGTLPPGEAVAALVRARELDRWSPSYRERASVLGDQLHAEGLEARASGDWELAYRRFSDAVQVDRTRSWSRRYAEEARAQRLGIDPESWGTVGSRAER
ncbi:MAG TPA: hypothetical protein ENK18_08190 [Deltaproteobacteria bacterium]|nr:hypothetical protein [Deltaproteobacteria bacterium]